MVTHKPGTVALQDQRGPACGARVYFQNKKPKIKGTRSRIFPGQAEPVSSQTMTGLAASSLNSNNLFEAAEAQRNFPYKDYDVVICSEIG